MGIATRITGLKAMMRFDNRWQFIGTIKKLGSDLVTQDADVYRFSKSKL